MKQIERPCTGPGYIPAAPEPDIEHYRAQAKGLFGNTNLPAVVYKGRLYPERQL